MPKEYIYEQDAPAAVGGGVGSTDGFLTEEDVARGLRKPAARVSRAKVADGPATEGEPAATAEGTDKPAWREPELPAAARQRTAESPTKATATQKGK